MRALRTTPVALLVLVACGPSPVLTVTLSNASFVTSGANLFNCSSPEQPASPTGVSSKAIACDPAQVGTGYATTVVTEVAILGCGNGNGAAVQVTCSGVPGSHAVSGTVSIEVDPSCDARQADGGTTFDPDSAVSADYGPLAPGQSQTVPALTACSAGSNVCPTSDACAFNELVATITVANVGN